DRPLKSQNLLRPIHLSQPPKQRQRLRTADLPQRIPHRRNHLSPSTRPVVHQALHRVHQYGNRSRALKRAHRLGGFDHVRGIVPESRMASASSFETVANALYALCRASLSLVKRILLVAKASKAKLLIIGRNQNGGESNSRGTVT